MTPLKTFPLIWHAFEKYRWQIAALVVLGLLSAIFEGIGINAAIPLFSFLLDGGVTPADGISQFLHGAADFVGIPFTFRALLVFILALFVLRAASVVFFGYIRARITTDFINRESQQTMRAMLKASWPYLLKQKIGTMQTTMVRDIQRAGNLLDSLGQIIQSFGGFLMYFLVAVNISFTTTMFTFFGGVVLLLIIRPLLSRIQLTGTELALTEKDVSQSLSQQITGMKSLKAAGVEDEVFREAGSLMSALRRLQVRISAIKAISAALFQPFTLVFISVAFYISYHSPGFSLVSFGATLYLIQKMFTYLESGQSGLHSLNETAPNVRHYYEFKNTLLSQAEKNPAAAKSFSFNKEITFDHVSFHYKKESPILKDVSFSMERGRMLALIGPSGAGKTSVADLLLRLFSPTHGSILIDGQEAESITLEEWRSNVGYVTQEGFLFNGSIEENIRFYRPEITLEAIQESARQANIYDFIMALPDGFSTLVGDRGIMLSGGQRQRVVLARALASKPPLLVLDEATSALDSESEELIQNSIRALHGNTTVFVIAHRLSTIENADHILVLDQGSIIEQGSPAELRATPGSYFAKHA